MGIVGTRLDRCSLCHTSVPSRNAYGAAYTDAGRSFAAIENQDSDGDGYLNLAELQALSFPGNSTEVPEVIGEGEGEGAGEGEGFGCAVTIARKLERETLRFLPARAGQPGTFHDIPRAAHGLNSNIGIGFHDPAVI